MTDYLKACHNSTWWRGLRHDWTAISRIPKPECFLGVGVHGGWQDLPDEAGVG